MVLASKCSTVARTLHGSCAGGCGAGAGAGFGSATVTSGFGALVGSGSLLHPATMIATTPASFIRWSNAACPSRIRRLLIVDVGVVSPPRTIQLSRLLRL